MTLTELLSETHDHHVTLKTGAIMVFARDGRQYYDLSDYVVSSAVSGPSLILVPRAVPTE